MPNILKSALRIEEAVAGRVFSLKTLKVLGAVAVFCEGMHRATVAYDNYQEGRRAADQDISAATGQTNPELTQPPAVEEELVDAR